jgi:hypothetical protein
MDGDMLISESARRLSVSSGYLRLLERGTIRPRTVPLLADILRPGSGDPKEKLAGPKSEREGRKEYRGEVRTCDGRNQPM